MAYIGHSPTNAGTFYILDDLTMGSGTTYGLAVGGVSVSPSADNLLITLDGVIQHPTDAYTVSGSNIVFATGPGSGVEFYGIIMGQSASTGQGSIGADELKVSGDGSSGQVLTSDGDGTFSWATDTENYLPLAGGTMSGAINLGSQNVTNGGTITGTFVGNVNGNASGTALTVTQAAQSAITSVGTLTSLTGGTGDFNWDSNTLVVDSSASRVGIGLTAPDTTLHIAHPTTTIDYYENKGLLISEAGSANGIVAFSRTDSECYIGMNKDLSGGEGYLGLGMNLSSDPNKKMALWIRESGNVGIGTASPDQIFHIKNTGTHTTMRIENDNADFLIQAGNHGADGLHFYDLDNTAYRMTIANTGNVGIGTASPSYPLDIEGSSNDGSPLLRATATNTPSDAFNWASEFISSNLANDKRFTHIWGKTRGTYGMAHLSYMPKSTSSESYLALGLWGANDVLNVLGNGKVGIGTTSPEGLLHIDGANAVSSSLVVGDQSGTEDAAIFMLAGTGVRGCKLATRHAINGFEISMSNGDGNTSGFTPALVITDDTRRVGIGVTDPECELEVSSDAFGKVFYVEYSSGTNSSCYGMQVGFPNANPNDTSRNFIHCWDSVESKFIAYSDGSVGSAPNTYGGVSDERVKQDIRDSKSQWDDIKAIKVRNFKLKSEVFQYGDETPEHIGVIAQEVEDAGMDKLVSHHPPSKFQIENCDIEEDDTVKGMKYSILYMKAIKALQEAMERIEALENA